MCGRYRLSRRKQIIEEHFDSVSGEEDWSPRYNIAPTQPIPVIRQNLKEPVRELSLMRWGLIPSWAKDSSTAASMINARAETASTKPAHSAGGLPERKTNGSAPADTSGTRSIREVSAPPACTNGLRHSASRAADGRCIRAGMRILEK